MKKNRKAAALMVGLLSIATLGGRAMSNYIQEPEGPAQVRISVTSMDSSGLTARDFNTDFLRSLRAYILQEARQLKRDSIDRQGLSSLDVEAEMNRVSSEALYVHAGSKLALVRLQMPGRHSVDIVGFVDDKLRRINCSHSFEEIIPVSYGSCAEKIEEVFGQRPEMQQ
jgi:hypothetical protein